MKYRNKFIKLAALLMLINSAMLLVPIEKAVAENNHVQDTPHKIVIHVSSDDQKTQQIALNNAVNLQKHYGIDNVLIEIVAYGPGLSLLTEDASLSKRVSSLSQQEIRFSACANTMRNIARKKGKEPTLTEGVEIVPAGVARIIELQEIGYSYVRP